MIPAFEGHGHGNTYEPVRIYACRTYKQTVKYTYLVQFQSFIKTAKKSR